MLFNMNKASDNMLLSATQLDHMYREQQAELYKEQEEKITGKESQINSYSIQNGPIKKIGPFFLSTLLHYSFIKLTFVRLRTRRKIATL